MRTPRGRRRARWRHGCVVVAVAAAALLTSAGPASAHNVLVSSNPAADTVLAKAPSTVTLVFDQDVQNIYAEMAITIGTQAPVAFTPTVNGRDVTADLSLQNLPIHTGAALTAWKIGYRVVSADGHPVTGLVNFSVGTAAAGAPSTPPSASAVAPGSGSGVPWLPIEGVAAALLVVAAVVLLLVRRRSSSG